MLTITSLHVKCTCINFLHMHMYVQCIAMLKDEAIAIVAHKYILQEV